MDDGRQTAHHLVQSIQSYLTPGMKVLDVGAGTGNVTFALAPLLEHGQIVGIDADENAVVYAQYKAQKQGRPNITFQKGDALLLAFADSSFDMVVANQLPLDQEKVVAELTRVTRPGGIIGVARPNSPKTQLWNFLYDIACEIAGQSGIEPPEKIIYTRSDPAVIQAIFDQVGLEIIAMEEKAFIEGDLERSLLGLMVEAEFPLVVSYAAQIDENDTTAMIQGYLDFLEAREKVFYEKYNGKVERQCLIAVGRKPQAVK